MPHCLLLDVTDEMQVMHDEIFGPLLPVIRFGELDEVIDRINAGEKPLALYVWGQDRARVRRVLDQTSSGGVCVNNTVVHALHPLLPFGTPGRSRTRESVWSRCSTPPTPPALSG